ncbi:MAG: ABC transporter substrate-binding protein, partial [Pseudomonadota bacterium]|nr:ABC transporter substrate-binding protein [Pseudomonadota bacterium]
IATRLSTGDYGDVLDTPRAVAKDELPDFFLPLDDLNLAKDFYFADTWAVKGKPYGFTYGVSVEGVAYNKAAFAKAKITNVPKTYDEFIADAHKLKDAGIIPIVLNMGDGWPLETTDGLALDFSGDANFRDDMLKDNTPFSADKPYGKAFAITHQWIKDGLTEADLTTSHWEDSKGWMASGKGAMWFLGSWSINQIIQDGSTKAGIANYDANNIGYFPLPYDNSGGPYNVTSGPDYGVSVAKNSKNPVTAKAWLDFLLTKSNLSQNAGFIPGYKGLQPTLIQMSEFTGYKPKIIERNPGGTAYNNAVNLINFAGGKGAQEVMLASDYKAEIEKLNKSWADAVSRGK